MNLVVTEMPFGDGTLDAHLDTSRASSRSTRATSTRPI